MGAAIPHRTAPVLPSPLGGVSLLVPACCSTHEVWVRRAVVGRIKRRHGQLKGDWKLRCTALQRKLVPPHEVWMGRGVIGRRRPISHLRVFGRGNRFWESPTPALSPPLSGRAGRPVVLPASSHHGLSVRLSVRIHGLSVRPPTDLVLDVWSAGADHRLEPCLLIVATL